MVSPDSQAPACPSSGRNSTYRPVQISEAGSKFRRLLDPTDRDATVSGREILHLLKFMLVASALVVVWAVLFKLP